MDYIYDESKLKFHYFFWATGFLRVLSYIGVYIQEKMQFVTLHPSQLYGRLTYRDIYTIDCIFLFAWLVIEIIMLIGLPKRHLYAWFAVFAMALLDIVYAVYTLCFFFETDGGTALGKFFGLVIWSVFIALYYLFRKPLFWPEKAIDRHYLAYTLCPQCKRHIPNDSLFCDHCGRKVADKPLQPMENNLTNNNRAMKVNIDVPAGDNHIQESKNGKDVDYEDIKRKLEHYKAMFDEGLISQEEYNLLKSKLLGI